MQRACDRVNTFHRTLLFRPCVGGEHLQLLPPVGSSDRQKTLSNENTPPSLGVLFHAFDMLTRYASEMLLPVRRGALYQH